MKSLLIVIILFISGCTFAPKASAPMVVYNFGISLAPNIDINPSHTAELSQVKPLSLLITDVTAPSWLDNPAIYYRLAYHNPAQLHTYANSRWAATPSALLTQQIRNRFSVNDDKAIIKPDDAISADYALHLSLEEFVQIFDKNDKSYVVISLQASLIKRHTRTLLAQHNFQLQRTTPSADAAGAVYALIEISDQLSNDLIAWVASEQTNSADDKLPMLVSSF